MNFFPRGFPYILSLYLGGGAICLAAFALGRRRAGRAALLGLAAAAAVVCLGKYARLSGLVDLLPALHAFRYPTKAFFTVHFAVAALAAFGLARLVEEDLGRWRRFAALAAAAGATLASVPLWPRLMPGATRYFLSGFCPPEFPWPLRLAIGDAIAADAATGGLVLLCIAGLALLTARGRLRPQAAAAALVALVGADLVRAGAGLNPSVTRAFYELSPEAERLVSQLRSEDGRVFSCGITSSPAYLAARATRGVEHESLTFAAMQETFTPDFNVPWELRSALSIDRTMLVPESRVTTPDQATCTDIASLLPRLRAAGVTHVVSLDPLADAGLLEAPALEPSRIAPLRVHVYRLREPRPYLELLGGSGQARVLAQRPGNIDVEVDAPAAGRLLVREAHAPGWSAERDGRRLPLTASESGHSSIEVPAGRSRVALRYRSPGLRLGGFLSAAAALACIPLLAGRPRSTPSG
jgi:hypothetical protein